MPIEFTFDEALHICRDLRGHFIPSATQIMEAQGLSFDFKRYVEPDLLDRRKALGKDVHWLVDEHDIHDGVPDTWLTDQTALYLQSWIGFKRQARFVTQESSVRMCEAINGFPLTGELDKFGMLAVKHPAIVDIKTGAAKADYWGIQTALYEMLRFRSPKIGRVIRAVAQLHADGSPGELIEFGEVSPVDGISYADTGLAALQNVYWRMRRGYLTENDFLD